MAQLKKKLLNRKCVFWFALQILSAIFLILRRIQADIIIHTHRYSCKASVILVEFWLDFLTDSRKILKCQILWKSYQCRLHDSMTMVGWTDRQTDTTNILVPFHNFANITKNLPNQHSLIPSRFNPMQHRLPMSNEW